MTHQMVYHYTDKRRGDELELGTRIRILLPHSKGKTAKITAYHQEACEALKRYDLWYHIEPEDEPLEPSHVWIIHPNWFEVID